MQSRQNQTLFLTFLLLHYRLHCSCFILFPSVHTSLFSFHLIFFSPHFIDHVSFLFPSVHLIHFIYHSPSHSYLNLPYLVPLILHGHSTLLSLSLFSQSRLWKLTTFDKFLILNRYSLFEAELRWLCYYLCLYIKQEIQHDVRRNVLACSAAHVYLLIYSTEVYLGKL